ncbi:hypothetical protein LIER_26582 [Lithospermum erythrorhizon]|uniref:Uncharacterized protein n=1 Tax=Lithospermum erythrorhizon TaxID=34254 RepID=A0AAV3RAY8_LITER
MKISIKTKRRHNFSPFVINKKGGSLKHSVHITVGKKGNWWMESLDALSPRRWLPASCPSKSEISRCRYTKIIAPFDVDVPSSEAPQRLGAIWLDLLLRHSTGRGLNVWASPRHHHLHLLTHQDPLNLLRLTDVYV